MDKREELRKEYCEKHGYIDAIHINHRVYSEWLEQKIIELTQPQQTVSDEEIAKESKYFEDKNMAVLGMKKSGCFQMGAKWMRDKLQAQTNGKNLSDLWRLAQKYNCDDFVNMVNSTKPHSVDRDKELIELIKKKIESIDEDCKELNNDREQNKSRFGGISEDENSDYFHDISHLSAQSRVLKELLTQFRTLQNDK